MSRTRQAFFLVLALAVVGCGAAVSGDEKPTGDVEKQIQALNARVASLEKEILALKQAGAAGAAAAAVGADPAAEAEASAAYSAIQQKLSAGNYDEAKKDMATFLTKYGKTKTAASAQRMATELAVFGKESPKNWGISKWFQGEGDVKLDGSGTTMVVFWEVWCPHCVKEVPKLQQLYTQYKPKGLQIIGVTKVTKSATDEKVTDFITQSNVSYPVAKEDGTLSAYFNVQGIPAAAVIKNGKIVWRGHPAQVSEAMLQGWL